MVTKKKVTITECVCDICQYKWALAPGAALSTHCASIKCRSRRWNRPAKPSGRPRLTPVVPRPKRVKEVAL